MTSTGWLTSISLLRKPRISYARMVLPKRPLPPPKSQLHPLRHLHSNLIPEKNPRRHRNLTSRTFFCSSNSSSNINNDLLPRPLHPSQISINSSN